MRGLSPRTRGNRETDSGAGLLPGSIPAHAGEPARCPYRIRSMRVYPRARGGTVVEERDDLRRRGLSPRTRGNPKLPSPRESNPWSIPAHAGEPTCWKHWKEQSGVYPRARGGTLNTPPLERQIGGLSPRTRGNRRHAGSGNRGAGSIPAHAGEPATSAISPSNTGVYPRARGGTLSGRFTPIPDQGLSPRTRGNLVENSRFFLQLGFIPAHAGEPWITLNGVDKAWVYPRARGGTRTLRTLQQCRSGLSPRTRGNPYSKPMRYLEKGSIPAHAGEPHSSSREIFCGRVYPRARGGTRDTLTCVYSSDGLSPRTRGNRPAP